MIKFLDILLEISGKMLLSRTPKQFKDRASDIMVKLKTVTPQGKYVYQSRTLSNGHIHKQFIKPLYPDKKLVSMDQNMIVSCTCGNHRYENEYSLWKGDASHMLHSDKSSPTIRNPKLIKKVCKHIVAALLDIKKRL